MTFMIRAWLCLGISLLVWPTPGAAAVRVLLAPSDQTGFSSLCTDDKLISERSLAEKIADAAGTQLILSGGALLDTSVDGIKVKKSLQDDDLSREARQLAKVRPPDFEVFVAVHSNSNEPAARGPIAYWNPGQDVDIGGPFGTLESFRPETGGRSKHLAEFLRQQVFSRLVKVDPTLGTASPSFDGGVDGRLRPWGKAGHPSFLEDPVMPHALIEVAFHDNPDDCENLLKKPAGRAAAAQGIADAILAYVGEDQSPPFAVVRDQQDRVVEDEGARADTLLRLVAGDPFPGVGLRTLEVRAGSEAGPVVFPSASKAIRWFAHIPDYPLGNLSENRYFVVGVDALGKGGTLRRFIVDRTAPQKAQAITDPPASQTVINTSPKITVQLSAVDPAPGGGGTPSGVAGFRVVWDQSATTVPPEDTAALDVLADAGGQGALAYDPPEDGTWWLHVRARDRAGHWSAV